MEFNNDGGDSLEGLGRKLNIWHLSGSGLVGAVVMALANTQSVNTELHAIKEQQTQTVSEVRALAATVNGIDKRLAIQETRMDTRSDRR